MDYFKTLVWPGGGYIGLLLWGLSIVTLAIIIQYFISIRRGNVMPDLVRQQIQGLFENKQYREAIEVTAAEPSLLSYVVHAALAEAAHGYPAMERAMEEAAEEKTTGLLRKIEWLNLIGNVMHGMGNANAAREQFRRSLTICQSIASDKSPKSLREVCQNWIGIAGCCETTEQYQRARDAYVEAQRAIESLGEQAADLAKYLDERIESCTKRLADTQK